MRIALQTWGSDGDIRPFIALAAGLAKAGHQATVAITSVDNRDYSDLCRAAGVEAVPVGRLGVTPESNRRLIAKVLRQRSPLVQLKSIMEEFFDPLAEEMMRAADRLCRDHQAVIGHFIVYQLGIAAERHGRPYVSVALNHSVVPSRRITPLGFPAIGDWANPLWWALIGLTMDAFGRGPVNRVRRGQGLPPLRSLMDDARPLVLDLVAVSPALCPRPDDWPDIHQVTGFLNMPLEHEQWPVPAGLEGFLGAGPAPVYLTFGSMLGLAQTAPFVADTTRLLVDAAGLAGCRAIVQSQWELLSDLGTPPSVYRAGRLDHASVFPRCAVVVHHGGAGTTQSATACGLPSVVVPYATDQWFWGRELHRLGLAPKPIPRRSLTAANLSRAIRRALDDDRIRQRAGETGNRMADENGVARAVQLIERALGHPRIQG